MNLLFAADCVPSDGIYTGIQSTSWSGYPCVRWQTFYEYTRAFDISMFPDESWDDLANKCRWDNDVSYYIRNKYNTSEKQYLNIFYYIRKSFFILFTFYQICIIYFFKLMIDTVCSLWASNQFVWFRFHKVLIY